MSDDDLIRRHISRGPERTPDDARLIEHGVHMWALAGCVACYDAGADPIEAMVADYAISYEEARAAWAYITRWRPYIDARLLLMGHFDGDGL